MIIKENFIKFAASSLASLSPLSLATLLRSREMFFRGISQTIKAFQTAYAQGLRRTSAYRLYGQEQSRPTVTVRVRGGDHSLPYSTLIPMIEVLIASRAERVLEIGTQYGNTTWFLAANLPDGGRLVTVDLPPESTAESGGRETQPKHEVGRFFRDTPESRRITQMLQDSRTLDPKLFDLPFDYVFIDGNHAYDFARSDTRTALRLLAEEGTIVWHDYYTLDPRIGVRTLLHQLRDSGLPVFHLDQTTCGVMRLERGTKDRALEIVENLPQPRF